MQVTPPAATLPTLAWLNEPLPPLRPATAERYADFQPLGCGGKAEVFCCRDQWLGREVAYKVLHHRLLATPRDAADFTREARVLAGLGHPGIPAIFDIGCDCHGRPYFTQSLVEGRTLRAVVDELRSGGRIAEQRWPLERLAEILLNAADAVSHAHSRGVLHCDLKPDNVLVANDERVFVIDWGIACVPAESQQATRLQIPDAPPPTKPAQPHRGSPVYMAPEQAANDALDARTDVFGLGAVLYECLTFNPPATGRDVNEVLARIAKQTPPPPRECAPSRGVTPELERLVLRALARRPDERFATVDEFRIALRECQLDLLESFEREAQLRLSSEGSPLAAASVDWWALQQTD